MGGGASGSIWQQGDNIFLQVSISSTQIIFSPMQSIEKMKKIELILDLAIWRFKFFFCYSFLKLPVSATHGPNGAAQGPNGHSSI